MHALLCKACATTGECCALLLLNLLQAETGMHAHAEGLLQLHYEYGADGEHLLAYADVHSIYRLPGRPWLHAMHARLALMHCWACPVPLCPAPC